jgi:hypothetical protein
MKYPTLSDIASAVLPAVTLFSLSVGTLFCLPVGTAAAADHPISMTEAHVYVTKSSARMRIQLFAEDLFLFHDIGSDDADRLQPEELRRGLDLHRQFLLDKVTLRDAKGELYTGQVVNVQPFEIPDEGISIDDLMLHTATYELEFPFETPPEFLTLQQDISDENFIYPSEMKLTLHQAGTELTYTDNLKPGSAVTLRFDWNQEQLGDDATDEDWEEWFRKQREATLGITSYSSVYSFIYVEPAEVRHEVLIPLASLKTILPLKHQDPAFIEVGEQEAVRELIRNWLQEENPTLVNGTRVTPEFTRIDFYGLDLKDFAQQVEARRVSLASGRVGIIMTYRPEDDAVTEVSLTWDKFHSSMRKIRSVVFTYPDKLQRFEFSRFNEEADNTFAWTVDQNDLPQPVQSVTVDAPDKPVLRLSIASMAVLLIMVPVVAAGGTHKWKLVAMGSVVMVLLWPVTQVRIPHPLRSPPPVASAEATSVFQDLHRGTFRALDFGTENQIYRALEQSVDGPLLETLYLQLRESLQIKEQGGAVARVQSVEYADGETRPNASSVKWPGFRYHSTWTVSGTVEHWGHIHERQNQFAATFTIEPRDGNWKITDMQIEESKNVGSRTRLRRF